MGASTAQHEKPTGHASQSQAGSLSREGVPLSHSRRYYPAYFGLPPTVRYDHLQGRRHKSKRADSERAEDSNRTQRTEKVPVRASRKVFVRGGERACLKAINWEMAIGGELLRIVGIPVSPPSKLRVLRGAVQHFTRKSRQRLLRKARSVDRALVDLPTAVDLTYPGKPELVPTDGRIVKRHLDRFFDRLAYRFHQVTALWVEEFQERGAPHFHLMVYGLPARLAHAFKLWTSRAWWECVGSNDPDHLKAGTKVARVNSWGQAVGYLAAYAGKVEQKTIPEGFTNMGRFWGVKGRKRWPTTKASGVLPASSFFAVKRVLRSWVKRKTGRRDRFDTWWKGTTVYLSSREGFKVLAWAGAFG